MASTTPRGAPRDSPFVAGLRASLAGDEMLSALPLVLVAGVLAMLFAVWFYLTGCLPASRPHLLVDSIATPLLAWLFLAWLALRAWVDVGPGGALGFAVAAQGLAARWSCLFAEQVTAPVAVPVEEAPLATLVDVVRGAGGVAYAFGLAVVLASTVRATVRRQAGDGEQDSAVLHPRRSRVGRLVVPAIVLAFLLYVLVRSLPVLARMAV